MKTNLFINYSTYKLILFFHQHSDEAKKVSSREGMARSVSTSTLLKERVNVVKGRVGKLMEAIEAKDFPKFATIAMQESNQLHAICLDTWPPLMYLNATSFEIMKFVHKINELAKEVKVGYTFDAGSNGFLLVQEKDLSMVMSCLDSCFIIRSDEKKTEPEFLKDLIDDFPNKMKVDHVVIANIASDPKVTASKQSSEKQ